MTNRDASRFMARSQWRPEGMSPLTKFIVPERKIVESKRQITFILSTDTNDRDGDIIEQSGWVITEYQKNPVVLWAHDGGSPPVARAESVAVERDRLVSVAQFATREEYAFADTVYMLYKGGYLNAVSVGFIPLEIELLESDDDSIFPGFRFIRQELLEYSAVPIPSNPDALVVARGKGIDVAPCEEWLERMLDENKGGSSMDFLGRCYAALTGRVHSVKAPDPDARDTGGADESAAPGGDETDGDEELGSVLNDDGGAAVPVTDWPQPGMNRDVSLLTSEYRTWPIAEAKALRDDWTEIWALGGPPVGDADISHALMDFKAPDEETIWFREKWAARHVDDYDLEGVVSQIRHLVCGSRGIDYMRKQLSHAKEHVMNERDRAKGLSAEKIDAITDRVLTKAVIPAIERALRQHSGRVS